MDTGKTSNPTYSDYLSAGFIPLLCKGYHPKFPNMGVNHRIVAVGRVLGLKAEECFELGKNREKEN